MNKKLKIIFVVILLMIGVLFINHEVFAAQGKTLVDAFDGKKTGDISTLAGENLISGITGPILSAIRIVAIGIGMIMITYLGIKYMSAAPTEKASIKNQLVAFTIGIVVVVSATTLLQMAYKLVTNIVTGS